MTGVVNVIREAAGDEAIRSFFLDCRASLAMTAKRRGEKVTV